MAASPHAEKASVGASEEITTSPHPCEVGSELILEVTIIIGIREDEEEEKEDHDTHSKRK